MRLLQVAEVIEGSPASASGKVSRGDVILMVDGKNVSSQTVLQALSESDEVGELVSIHLHKVLTNEVRILPCAACLP